MTYLELIVQHYILSTCIAIVILTWLLLKVYALATFGVCRSKKRLDGQTVLITGCTSGIGKATAFELARRGARVIMAGIGFEESEQVKEEIIRDTNNPNIVVQILDLSLLQSVRKCAEEITAREDRLDVLIHNAGVLHSSSTATEEGLNTILAINVFGPFLLTHLLIDLLSKTENSRVVMVGSLAHRFTSINLDNINPLEDPSLWEKWFVKTYATSKLATSLLCIQMARILSTFNITVNCADPGVVNTSIVAGSPFPSFIYKLIPTTKTPEQGAQTAVFLAVSEEVERVTGKYFANCKEEAFAKSCNDPDLADRYWRLCEEIVQLKPSEVIRSRF